MWHIIYPETFKLSAFICNNGFLNYFLVIKICKIQTQFSWLKCSSSFNRKTNIITCVIILGQTGLYIFGIFMTLGSLNSRLHTVFSTVFLSVLTTKTAYWFNCWNNSSYFFGQICITYYRTEAKIFLLLSPRAIRNTDPLSDSCDYGGSKKILDEAGNWQVFLFFSLRTITD